MTKVELWELYVSKNNLLTNDEVIFTASGLKKFFDTTWEQGYQQGIHIARPINRNPSTATPDTPEFLRDLFKQFDN